MIWIYISFLLHFVINFKFCNGIFNGWYAEPGEYPFVVCFINIPTSTPHCVGLIVTKEKVLTSANCLEKDDLKDSKVIAGVVDVMEKTSDKFQESKLSKKEIHPQYQARKEKFNLYNIGVAILVQPFTFTATVKPLVISSENAQKMQESYYSFAGNTQDCFTFGWGLSNSISTNTSMPTSNQSNPVKLKVAGVMPEKFMNCSLLNPDKDYDLRAIGAVCAMPTISNSTPCIGDEGAGLVCGGRKNVYALLTDIISCGENKDAVYLLLSNYIEEYGLEHNADSAIRNAQVGNRILLIGLSASLFSWYFQRPYP